MENVTSTKVMKRGPPRIEIYRNSPIRFVATCSVQFTFCNPTYSFEADMNTLISWNSGGSLSTDFIKHRKNNVNLKPTLVVHQKSLVSQRRFFPVVKAKSASSDGKANLVNGCVTSGPDLSIEVNGLNFPNPFVIGSGPPGTNYSVMKKAFEEGWGGVICKTVTLFNISN